MARPEAVDAVKEAGEHGDPGRLEVEVAAPAVLVGEEVVVAGGHGGPRGGNVQAEERLSSGVAGFSPVETGMGDEDFDAGDEEGEEGEDRDPVSHAD